jgi:nuclear protein localization family protein 4
MTLTLRVRTQLGTWRVTIVNQLETFDDLLHRLEREHDAHFQTRALFQDPNGSIPYPKDATIASGKLVNGHMIYAFVDEEKSGAHESSSLKKSITKDGVIVNQPTTSALKSQAFRPGMLPLRSMKMQWTLNEFISLDDQFVYKVKHQEKSNCSVASIDSSALQKFQTYGRQLDFRTIRLPF